MALLNRDASKWLTIWHCYMLKNTSVALKMVLLLVIWHNYTLNILVALNVALPTVMPQNASIWHCNTLNNTSVALNVALLNSDASKCLNMALQHF
ncbi:hypothetical protein E2C01_081330 [Portunus trituberculatus]|uniref:Uncharacterized protein n=1 Tax=Portunus trituberculatus TaxID=210409 RepID=A0A5B7IPG7_PORTR|nr:hypothetical protein [Portunus trituberculatus]